MPVTDSYRVVARPTEEWARENADAIDNAFGNLLRGSNLAGYTLVLYEGDEVVASKGFDEETPVDEAVDVFLDDQRLARDEIDSWDLDR